MKAFYSFACSAIGKNHLEHGAVLQDASDCYEDDRCSVIVVSDGHGSENFPRSDRGSNYACEAATEAVREFLDGLEYAQLQSQAAQNTAVTQLCKNILLRWNDAVTKDAARNPFTQEEVAAVKEKYRQAYLVGEQTVHAYGATLLLAILTQDFFLAVRNGDGECVIMDEQGHFTAPVPGNSKNEASFVTSLCDEDAIEDFRYFYSETLPAAVILSSDGVENSYVYPEELFSLYRNICRKVAREGGPATEEEVKRALSVITARGSGDDVSIACCLNLARIQAVAPDLDQAAAERQAQLAAEKAARQHRASQQATDSKRTSLHPQSQHPEPVHSSQTDISIETPQEKSHTLGQKLPSTTAVPSEALEPADTFIPGTVPAQTTPALASVPPAAPPAPADDFTPAIFPEVHRDDTSI